MMKILLVILGYPYSDFEPIIWQKNKKHRFLFLNKILKQQKEIGFNKEELAKKYGPANMNKLLFLLSLFINLHVFSQEVNQTTSDSLKIEAVENFQKLYWCNPIKHYGWVTDYEKLYSKDEVKLLNDLITKFEKETSAEIAIVTVDSLRATDVNFDDLSLRIAQKWAIGKTGKDNGILIAISKHYRKIRIQNGN